MGGKPTESCGRCAMSTVVDVTESDADREGEGGTDPFDGERIEVAEGQLRAVSPSAWLEGIRTRLDSAATRVIYGRR